MIENGYDENQILGMDALNKAPRPSEETLNKNRWSKDTEKKGFKVPRPFAELTKSGGAGYDRPNRRTRFRRSAKLKKPKNEYQNAGGDSGTSSSSRQWGQSSWQPKSQKPPEVPEANRKWRPPVESDADVQRRMQRFMDKESPTGDQPFGKSR